MSKSASTFRTTIVFGSMSAHVLVSDPHSGERGISGFDVSASTVGEARQEDLEFVASVHVLHHNHMNGKSHG